MNMLPFLLARRILFSNPYEKGISTMTLFCCIGIFIGTFSLAIVTAIMHGFEVAIEEKMQGIHADIIIESSAHQSINYKVLAHVLSHEFPDITAFSPHTSRHVLIRIPLEDTAPTVAVLTAIAPNTEQKTTALATKIINPESSSASFEQLFSHDTIIIGKQYAYAHNLSIGDTVELLFTQEDTITHKKITFDKQPVTISGIFHTGIDEYDAHVIYCSFSLLKKLFPHASKEHIALKMLPHTDEKKLIDLLRQRTHLLIYSWKDLYPSLIATQKLEKYVSFFVIALILLVASMNIISLMYMHITHKRRDIALLKALGMNSSHISLIFWIMGMGIGMSAATLGLISALCAAYLIKKYPFITLPDTYYVTHVPIALDSNIILAVFVVVILFCCIATYKAVQQIKSINSSHVLRFEG